MKNKALPKSKAKTAYGLLSEVCALIKEEPKRYDQGVYIVRAGDGSRRWVVGDHGAGYESYETPACGTVGCVAGWVATLKRRRFGYEEAHHISQDILGLGDGQAMRLFSGDAVDGVGQTRTHASSGIAHIRRFQKKYAKQLKAKKV